MKKTFCDLCEEICDHRIKEDGTSCRKYFPYGSSFNGVDTDTDNLIADLCDECELKIYKSFVRKLKKEGKIDKEKPKTIEEYKRLVNEFRKRNKIGYYEFGLFVKEKHGKKIQDQQWRSSR